MTKKSTKKFKRSERIKFWFFLVLSLGIIACASKSKIENTSSNDFSENIDSLTFKTTSLFAKSLNKTVPEYQIEYGKSFSVSKNGYLNHFLIYDLTDTSSYYKYDAKHEFKIQKYHLYHYFPLDIQYSFSHIAFVGESEVTIFESINCTDRGDKVDDVFAFIKTRKSILQNYDTIIGNLAQYRKFGKYYSKDMMGQLQCDCEPCLQNEY